MSLKSNKILNDAKINLSKGLVDNALLLYQEAFKINKFNPETLIGLINCFFLKKDYQNVFNYFGKLEKIIKLDSELLYLKALSYIEIEEYNKAKEILLNVLNKNNKLKVLEKISFINKKLNNYSELEKNLLDLINIKKDDINLKKELIELYINLHKYSEAHRLIQEVKKNHDLSNDIDFFELKILFEMKEYEKVIKISDEIINKGIKVNDVYLLKSKAFFFPE
ncbi:MAG: hypothetical protein KatS3mg068_1019 [Candidatus Sericytochromatia bacterium]|nr:MAG: hypothetical protein KatS3mg068_1019 [Candidatus Sericytochromatia bacterium]